MADYEGITRSNYFRVNNESEFDELCEGLDFDGEEGHIYSDVMKGEKRYCIAGYGSLDFIPAEERGKKRPEKNVEAFIHKLQPLLPEDEAVIIVEVGHKRLRDAFAYATIVTRERYEVLSLESLAASKAREMLGTNKIFLT